MSVEKKRIKKQKADEKQPLFVVVDDRTKHEVYLRAVDATDAKNRAASVSKVFGNAAFVQA